MMQRSYALTRNFSLAAVAAGCLLAATGCSYSGKFNGPSNTTPVTPTTATYVYAVDSTTSDVYAFQANATGTVSPVTTLVPPSGFSAYAVATDSSGQIYLSGEDIGQNATVLVYPKGSSGSATPTLTLLGGTNFYYPVSITVDSAGNLYVLDQGIAGGTTGVSVSEYSLGANGTATPIRTITDQTNTTLQAIDLAADSAGDVFVSTEDSNTDAGAIAEYPAALNGTVAASNIITTEAVFYGVAVDASGNIYAVVDNLSSGVDGAIAEFSSTATGAATPIRTISGAATTLDFGGFVRLDSDGNIFVVNQIPTTNPSTYDVLSFSYKATGDEAPMTTLTSSVLSAPYAALALY